MRKDFLIRLNQLDSSYLILLSLAALAAALGILVYSGALGWLLGILGRLVRQSILKGFRLWKQLFAWASWPMFLAVELGFVVLGWAVVNQSPGLTVVCALAPLVMGVTACLAYMYIDLERYEVGRGYKAVHNPLMGQELAVDLVRYGQQVSVPLLAASTVGIIGGFALLNQGLYETIGRSWYAVGDEHGAAFVDFLAYALINFLRIIDVLNVSASNQWLGMTYVRPNAWPAAALLSGFRMFFTLVLLQQIFASLRLGQLLAETVRDFWSPHGPIHERARHALPQYGAGVAGPLLRALRLVTALTKEQRDQLPDVLVALGPSTIPTLVRHLNDPQSHVRAVVAASLGRLHALDEVPSLIRLVDDSSDIVRQSLAEALGLITSVASQRTVAQKERLENKLNTASRRFFLWKRKPLQEAPDPVELAVATLRIALNDPSANVRIHAARALGQSGPSATSVTQDLVPMLKDADETVRCEAAEALGNIGGDQTTVAALIELLEDPSPRVKASACRALGSLKILATAAASALVPLLQNQDEAVRAAAAEAIAQIGPLTVETTQSLVEGLTSPDNTVRAQTAESLGTIGVTAQDTAPALVEAMTDTNDAVRAKAAEALGKIGAGAAEVAVPSLVRALRDKDNWVSALAAEALGQLGDSATEAVPALLRSLTHINAQVRSNAAESLGKMGEFAGRARLALETACADDEGGVRSQAMRALGSIGPPVLTSEKAVLAGFEDGDPQVRAAAVEAVGQWGVNKEPVLARLLELLDDANDQVKVKVTQVLPKLAGPLPEVIEGLCRRLLNEDSVLVQFSAAQALSKLGAAAASAGGPLLQMAQAGEVTLREQAIRAIAMIQPPEAGAAFAVGLKDADGEIRKMASAGLMKAPEIPEDIIPVLVEALHDPEIQVRTNVAHALARLKELPTEAVPLLIACTNDADDGLRLNAALALQRASGKSVEQAMEHLLDDTSLRIRLVAVHTLFPMNPNDPKSNAVLLEALDDSAVRLRRVALELIDSLGPAGAVLLPTLRQRAIAEEDTELRQLISELTEKLEAAIDTRPEEAK